MQKLVGGPLPTRFNPLQCWTTAAWKYLGHAVDAFDRIKNFDRQGVIVMIDNLGANKCNAPLSLIQTEGAEARFPPALARIHPD